MKENAYTIMGGSQCNHIQFGNKFSVHF